MSDSKWIFVLDVIKYFQVIDSNYLQDWDRHEVRDLDLWPLKLKIFILNSRWANPTTTAASAEAWNINLLLTNISRSFYKREASVRVVCSMYSPIHSKSSIPHFTAIFWDVRLYFYKLRFILKLIRRDIKTCTFNSACCSAAIYTTHNWQDIILSKSCSTNSNLKHNYKYTLRTSCLWYLEQFHQFTLIFKYLFLLLKPTQIICAAQYPRQTSELTECWSIKYLQG